MILCSGRFVRCALMTRRIFLLLLLLNSNNLRTRNDVVVARSLNRPATERIDPKEMQFFFFQFSFNSYVSRLPCAKYFSKQRIKKKCEHKVNTSTITMGRIAMRIKCGIKLNWKKKTAKKKEHGRNGETKQTKAHYTLSFFRAMSVPMGALPFERSNYMFFLSNFFLLRCVSVCVCVRASVI